MAIDRGWAINGDCVGGLREPSRDGRARRVIDDPHRTRTSCSAGADRGVVDMSWRDDAAALPNLAPLDFELATSRTALVIVDMQYVDAHRDYGLGASLKKTHPAVWDYYFTRVEDVVLPNVRRILGAFRAAQMRVIHLTVGPELADGADFLPFRRGAATSAIASQMHHRGTFEHGILPELRQSRASS